VSELQHQSRTGDYIRTNQTEPGRIFSLGSSAIFTLALLVYLATLSKAPVFKDGFGFALEAEYGAAPNSGNHILYPFIPSLFYRVWQLLGWEYGAMLPLQVFNAICGAASVVMVFLIVVTLTKNQRVGLITSAGFGISVGVWAGSVHVETSAMPLALSLALFLTLARNRNPERASAALAIAGLCVLSIGTYLTGVFLVVVAVIGFLMNPALNWRVRVKQAALVAMSSGVFSLLLHIYCAVAFVGVRSLRGFLDWQFSYSSLDLWGKPTLIRGTAQSIQALVKNVGVYPGLQDPLKGWLPHASTLMKILSTASYLAVLAAFLATLIVGIRQRHKLRVVYSRAIAMLLVWGFLYAAFAWYWVQSDVLFWVPVMTSWWLLCAILLSNISEPPASRAHGACSLLGMKAGLPLAVAILFTVNLLSTVLPNMRHDCNHRIAQQVKMSTSSSDLIITLGHDSSLSRDLLYHARRMTLPVDYWIIGYLQQPVSPLEIANAPLTRGTSRPNVDELIREIDSVADEVRSAGGRVFSIGSFRGANNRWSHLPTFTESENAHFRGRPVWNLCGEELHELS
jgi:hypothetical protein